MSHRILIIDDDPDIVLFLSTLLRDHGFETVEAPDGRSGLERVKSENPDLIFLDLMMPRKSGIAFLHDLQKDETLRRIPVIMITGVSGETGVNLDAFFSKDQERGAAAPRGFIEKPVDPKKLLSLVDTILKRI